MRFKHLIFPIFIFFVFNSVFGQREFKSGYMITKTDDTIMGYINDQGDKNYKLCEFRLSEKSNSRFFSPDSIKAYRIYDGKFYISKEVPKDKSIKLFVEYLVNGIADLYYFRDGRGQHFLIEKDDGSLIELTNEEDLVYKDDEGQYIKMSNDHIGLLAYYFSDCMIIQPEIKNVKVTRSSLMDITKKYHTYVCDDQKCIVYEQNLPVARVGGSLYIGYDYSTLTIRNDPEMEDYVFDNSSNPIMGGAVSVHFPRLSEKFSLQFDFQYGKFSTNGNKLDYHGPAIYENYDIEVSYNFFKYILSGKQIFTSARIKPAISFGVGFMKANNLRTACLITSTNFSQVETSNEYDLPFESVYGLVRIMPEIQYPFTKRMYLFLGIDYQYQIGFSEEFATYMNILGINLGFFF